MTKTCKICGNSLPLEKMVRHGIKDGQIRYINICKKCANTKRRKERHDKNIKLFLADPSMKIHRKYKEIRPERILPIEESGITPIEPDEVFVKLLDYRNVWISNHGRALSQYGKRYSVMHKKVTSDREIAYQLYKNVYDGKKWTYKKCLVEAWKLVVQEFVINYDIANNICCWHRGNDKRDNYYKHLYPLNQNQYKAVNEHYRNTGEDSEKSILEFVNSIKYRAEGWKPKCMKRSMFGIGYLGCSDTNGQDVIYRKWANMMQRCYSDVTHRLKPYYKGCTVCEEWWNFSNFRVWYRENIIEGRQFDLDKDILVQGNNVYSPDTCALVSHYANTVFEERGIKSNIVRSPETGKFQAAMFILGKRIEIGLFDTEEMALAELFEYKKNYITKFAIKSKNKVPDKVYYAMMRWDAKKTQ